MISDYDKTINLLNDNNIGKTLILIPQHKDDMSTIIDTIVTNKPTPTKKSYNMVNNISEDI